MWLWLGAMSAQERLTLWKNIKHANPVWVLLSFLFSVLSHISRAYRWRFMLEPLGYKPQLKNSVIAVMTGYFANTFVMRSGEVLRAMALQQTDQVPFEKAFGTVVSERIADLIMLLLVMVIALSINSTALLDYFKEDANPIPTIIVLVVLLTAGVIVLRLLKKSKNPLVSRLRNFGLGILEGVKSILKMKKTGAFIGHTLFIWFMYIAMFWIVTLCVPGLKDVPFGTILAAFVIGAFAMSATNAGMGLYPLAMATVFTFFGFKEIDGNTFGGIIWGTQTLFNVLLGGICALYILFLGKHKKSSTLEY